MTSASAVVAGAGAIAYPLPTSVKDEPDGISNCWGGNGKGGKELRGLCAGDGPIDASFLAIEQIVGHHYELDDFQIQAVTEGREAMGETVVRLRSGGRIYSGRGISTDIIGSGIAAYVNALNKIAYEEENA